MSDNEKEATKTSSESKSANELPSLFCQHGGESSSISNNDMKRHLHDFLTKFIQNEPVKEQDKEPKKRRVLIVPPDYTRFHSRAGILTQYIHEFFLQHDKTAQEKEKEEKSSAAIIETEIVILPALGTHAPMTDTQIESMYGKDLLEKKPSPFVVHDWRNDVVTIGHAPKEMVHKATNGMVNKPWPAQLNKLIWEGNFDLILSIGQVVPHEVMGMANFNKNLFVGTGGVDAINLSHFIGAVHGMENMMGRASNPLRDILNYASEKFLQEKLNLWYVLTVVGAKKEDDDKEGAEADAEGLCTRGFFIGKDIQCYLRACELSLQVNFTLLDTPLPKVVAYLHPDEFHSTWLGNKAIYRTRMALADKGQLIILAPGLKKFGEDEVVDGLIRRYGYRGTKQALQDMEANEELKENLSAVAHMIHGSTEGRFQVTYCPGHLTKTDVEGVGFGYGDLQEMQAKYPVEKLKDGWNTLERDGEEKDVFYFIRNPALGLWAVKSHFEDKSGKEGDGGEKEAKRAKTE